MYCKKILRELNADDPGEICQEAVLGVCKSGCCEAIGSVA